MENQLTCCLTFVFGKDGDQILSPPKDTYNSEPDKSIVSGELKVDDILALDFLVSSDRFGSWLKHVKPVFNFLPSKKDVTHDSD